MTPNQQYKDLDPDDVIQEGDITLNFFTKTWRNVVDWEIGNKPSDYSLYKFRRPIPAQESAIAPSHHLERSGFCNVCGQPNEHVPCACVPVQEVEAGKEKCEEKRKERCVICSDVVSDWVDPDWSTGRICEECYIIHNPRIEEVRESLIAIRIQRNELRSQLTTLRTQLDKAVKALELGLTINVFRSDQMLANQVSLFKEAAQQTLADIKKGER